MATTYAELLEAAKDGLARLLAGDVVSFELGTGSGGAQQKYTMRDIGKLQSMVDWLETKAAAETANEEGRGRTALAIRRRD